MRAGLLRAEVWPESGFVAVGELDDTGLPRVQGIWCDGSLMGVDYLAAALGLDAADLLAMARAALASTLSTAGASP